MNFSRGLSNSFEYYANDTGVHIATHNLIIARTSGKNGDASGLTPFSEVFFSRLK